MDTDDPTLEPMLSHERLDVYQRAIQFLAFVEPLLGTLKRHRELQDQLLRAAISIPLHIAEGCGKTQGPDRARFFSMARGSAMESAAILDGSYVLKSLSAVHVRQGKKHLVAIVQMLTKLLR